MSYQKIIQTFVFTLIFFLPFGVVQAGNIVPGNEEARFFDTDSLINFGLTQGDVTVTDSEVTGYAWAEDWGWINMQPTGAGVTNDGDGNLSGYAWGETVGWINFAPTLGGVSIDGDGFFTGYAWSENGGWIVFSCETDASCGDLEHRVQTTWPEGDEQTTPPSQQIPPESVEPEDELETEPEIVDDPIVPEPPALPVEPVEPEEEEFEEEDDEGGEETPVVGGSDDEEGEDPENESVLVVQEAGPIEILVEQIVQVVEQVLENPFAETSSTLLATVGTFAGALSVATFAFLTPLHITELILLPSRLWTLLLAALGFRRKRLPWGIVYDSVTKQPLDPAYVQLLLKGTEKEADTAFTDLDGRFGFLPKTGSYTMKARKTNYAFPSKRLIGNNSDALYDNLYFGEPLTITSENDTVIRNIPLDPIGVDWNEVQKRKGSIFNFYSKYDVIFYTFTSILFYLGLAISIFAAFFFPSLTHTVILIIYALVTILRGITGSPKRLGRVFDTNGEPLAYGAVRVYLANTENQVKQVVTNQFGRFYCLVVPATYYVKVFKRVGEEDFQEIYTSPNFYAKDGLVDGEFGG
jgi:hypothetical protein